MSESKEETIYDNTPNTSRARKTLPKPSYRYSPKTREELKKAVREWCECEEKAYEKYQSHISDWDVSNVTDMSCMFFGKETFGLPKEWMERFSECCFTLPMWEPGVRSLNLGSSVAVVLYDGLRQLGKF